MLACYTAMLNVASLTDTNPLPGVLCLYFGMHVCLEIPKLCAEPGVVRGCPCTLERLVLDPCEPLPTTKHLSPNNSSPPEAS